MTTDRHPIEILNDAIMQAILWAQEEHEQAHKTKAAWWQCPIAITVQCPHCGAGAEKIHTADEQAVCLDCAHKDRVTSFLKITRSSPGQSPFDQVATSLFLGIKQVAITAQHQCQPDEDGICKVCGRVI